MEEERDVVRRRRESPPWLELESERERPPPKGLGRKVAAPRPLEEEVDVKDMGPVLPGVRVWNQRV